MKKALSRAFIMGSAFMPVIAFALTSPNSCEDIDSVGALVNCFTSILDSVIYVLIALGVMYVIYGAYVMISNEEKREDGKKTIYYGVIGLFVMVSVWGLVNVLSNTFTLSGTPIEVPDVRPTLNR
jgi:hypothetical protein